jgi:hypothetical protein
MREREIIPHVVFMNRKGLFNGQPSNRSASEANYKWITDRKEQRGFVRVRSFQNLQHPDPSRKLRHVADKPVAGLDFAATPQRRRGKPDTVRSERLKASYVSGENSWTKYAMSLFRVRPANAKVHPPQPLQRRSVVQTRNAAPVAVQGLFSCHPMLSILYGDFVTNALGSYLDCRCNHFYIAASLLRQTGQFTQQRATNPPSGLNKGGCGVRSPLEILEGMPSGGGIPSSLWTSRVIANCYTCNGSQPAQFRFSGRTGNRS